MIDTRYNVHGVREYNSLLFVAITTKTLDWMSLKITKKLRQKIRGFTESLNDFTLAILLNYLIFNPAVLEPRNKFFSVHVYSVERLKHKNYLMPCWNCLSRVFYAILLMPFRSLLMTFWICHFSIMLMRFWAYHSDLSGCFFLRFLSPNPSWKECCICSKNFYLIQGEFHPLNMDKYTEFIFSSMESFANDYRKRRYVLFTI